MKKFAALLFAFNLFIPATSFAYGAIAVDDQRGNTDPAYGFSVGQRNKEQAQRVALRYCRKYGDHCKAIVWFETCGAYAASRKYYGYGYGATKATAVAGALKMCARNSCKIVVAECE